MATDVEEPTLTVDELAARAGITVRTVRFYSTKGLLPPPVIGPRRVGHYSRRHLYRLALIEELQHQGMTLAGIERYLQQLPEELSAHGLAIHRAVVASWAPDSAKEVSRAELERRAGRPLGELDVDRLAAMSVVREAAAPDTYHVDLGLLRLGIELLDLPIAHETILAARTVLWEHTRAAAHELFRLFRDEMSEHESVAAVKDLSAPVQPLVAQVLLTVFQRALKEELREWLTDES